MTRSEYRSKLEESLKTMETRIGDLENDVERTKAEAKSKLRKLVNEVKSKRDSVRKKLSEVGTATDSAWDELKIGLDGAWSELEKSYERARSLFTDEGKQSADGGMTKCA